VDLPGTDELCSGVLYVLLMPASLTSAQALQAIVAEHSVNCAAHPAVPGRGTHAVAQRMLLVGCLQLIVHQLSC
jgi:hypothetical protein